MKRSNLKKLNVRVTDGRGSDAKSRSINEVIRAPTVGEGLLRHRKVVLRQKLVKHRDPAGSGRGRPGQGGGYCGRLPGVGDPLPESRFSPDRKSTRLNSS